MELYRRLERLINDLKRSVGGNLHSGMTFRLRALRMNRHKLRQHNPRLKSRTLV